MMSLREKARKLEVIKKAHARAKKRYAKKLRAMVLAELAGRAAA